MNPRDVGQKILSLRKAQGMTQMELAQKLHVTNRAVSKWENGLNFPDLSLMVPLAKVLNVNVSELLDLEDKTPDEAFCMVRDISEEKREKLQKRIKHGLVTIIVLGAFVLIGMILALVNSEFTIFSLEAGCVYSAGIIIWSVELLVHFKRLSKKNI